jgi:tRNA 2-thiocytidine biosynthesis protein TtcA
MKQDTQALDKRLHFLLRKVKQVQKRWGIVEDGDRILLGLSGGKDSTVLLHLLQYWQRFAPEGFDFAALHVETRGLEGNYGNRKLLRKHVRGLGLKLNIVEVEYPETGEIGRPGFRCFRCSRERREALFTYAHKHGYNKVALAHHLDDAVETALMNLVFHAGLETMEPAIELFDGELCVIRPLILAEEREVMRVGSLLGFPFFSCRCLGEEHTERDRMRSFIRSFGRDAGGVKRNIWGAARRWREKTRST